MTLVKELGNVWHTEVHNSPCHIDHSIESSQPVHPQDDMEARETHQNQIMGESASG